MADTDYHDQLRPGMPPPWSGDAGQPDLRVPAAGLTSAAQWGLASVLIGCAVLLMSGIVLVFNVVLFRGGPAGIPAGLALAGGLIGAVAVLALGVGSVVFAGRGWQQAYAERSTPALPIAGLAVSCVGLLAWLITAIDLIMILSSFN